MISQDKLLTPIQAADILGIAPGTLNVWRATKRYPLPFIKVGRAVRYRQVDIEAFIESRRRGLEVEFTPHLRRKR